MSRQAFDYLLSTIFSEERPYAQGLHFGSLRIADRNTAKNVFELHNQSPLQSEPSSDVLALPTAYDCNCKARYAVKIEGQPQGVKP